MNPSPTVDFNREIVEAMARYMVDKAPLETGGVLIGKRTENSWQVLSVVPPPPDSKHERGNFQRGVEGLCDLLEAEMLQDRIYIGEWHTHPSSPECPSVVEPSCLDMESHASLAAGYGEPILMFIMGGDVEDVRKGLDANDPNTLVFVSVTIFYPGGEFLRYGP